MDYYGVRSTARLLLATLWHKLTSTLRTSGAKRLAGGIRHKRGLPLTMADAQAYTTEYAKLLVV